MNINLLIMYSGPAIALAVLALLLLGIYQSLTWIGKIISLPISIASGFAAVYFFALTSIPFILTGKLVVIVVALLFTGVVTLVSYAICSIEYSIERKLAGWRRKEQ